MTDRRAVNAMLPEADEFHKLGTKERNRTKMDPYVMVCNSANDSLTKPGFNLKRYGESYEKIEARPILHEFETQVGCVPTEMHGSDMFLRGAATAPMVS